MEKKKAYVVQSKQYVIMPALLMACISCVLVFTEGVGNGSMQPEAVFIDDAGFGTEGKVVFADGTAFFRSVAVQFDGKVVMAGGNRGNFALARYNSDGSPDIDFGRGGKVATDFGAFDYALAVAVQADGKIVAAGDSGGDFALARYLSDGSLDDTFGSGGKVISDIGGYDQVRAIALQADGKIVAAGGSSGADDNRFGLARYNGDGSSDHAFGKEGMVTIGSNGDLWAHSVAIQADGKIVAAGERVKGGESDFFLVRCLHDGSPDTDFGEGGKEAVRGNHRLSAAIYKVGR